MIWRAQGSELKKVPYINHIPKDGRVVCLQSFYSAEMSRFRMFLPFSNNNLIEMQTGGHPAQAAYWSKNKIDKENDAYFELPYLIANNLSFQDLSNISIALERDIYNFGSIIPKQAILFEYCRNQANSVIAIYNVFEMELEYLMGIIRSFYGLLHDVLRYLFNLYKLPKQLPDSLGSIADMGLKKAKRTYELKQPIMEYLIEILPIFTICRKIRDDIYHRGKDAGIVFYTDYGPGISIESPPLNEFNEFLQHDLIYQENLVEHRIGSLFYLFNKIIAFVLKSSDLLAQKIRCVFDLPQGISDEYKLFLTGPDIKYLNEIDKNLSKCWIKPMPNKNTSQNELQ